MTHVSCGDVPTVVHGREALVRGVVYGSVWGVVGRGSVVMVHREGGRGGADGLEATVLRLQFRHLRKDKKIQTITKCHNCI